MATKKEVKPVSALDRLKKVEVTKTPASSKKETMPVVPNFEKAKVDSYIKLNADLKDIEFQVEQLNAEITESAVAFLDSQSEFSKSARVYGTEASVRVVRADKFSVVQEMGSQLVTLGVATESRVVSLKKEILNDETKLNAFLSKFSDAEISEYLDVSVKYVTLKGLDEKIPTLDSSTKKTILEGVKQSKPSVVCE